MLKRGFVLLIILAISLCCRAQIINIDADGFAEGTNITSAFRRTAILTSVGGYSGLNNRVYACGDLLASTSTMVFGNNLSFQRQWYSADTDGFALRVDFVEPAGFVSIDIIGDDSGDIGTLKAYNSSNQLLRTITSTSLSTGEVFAATINRTSYDIAYIIAGGSEASGDTVHLDNITAQVPEPLTIAALAVGALLIRNKKR